MGDPPTLTDVSESRKPEHEEFRYDVVVSYNRAEGAVVERIARRLQGEGLRVFFDRWSMTAGRLWQDEILEAIQAAGACAVVIGREGLGDWAREELAVAQSRAAKDPRFRLFMVLLEGAPSPTDPRLAFLGTRSWVDFASDGGDGIAFDRLMTAVTGVPRHPEAASPIEAAPCPYRGLEAFDERHASLFFGRRDDTRRLCERLSGPRFVAVLGPSGSGKTSIVKAGLVPALRSQALSHSAEWTIRMMTPGGSPLAALAAQLAHLGAQESMQRTLDALSADERTLDLAVALALADRPPHDRVVLVVDQLEESFTLCRDEDEREAFLGNLTYAATIPGGRTIVVVTLRADFYYRCAPYPALRNLLALQHMLIGPLGDEGLRRAIEEPAWAAGLTLEPGLVDTIVADVGHRPGTLPLLQHVLVQVWQRRRGRLLTVEAYRESGGVQGALAKHADAVYEQLSETQRDVTERVLLRLVQPGEGTEDARRRVEADELLTGEDDAAVDTVLRRLADERLLTTSRDEASGERLVEITHEALLEGWPRLRRWIERDREALLAHRRLTEASREWERSGRDAGLLYRGTRLAAWRPSAERATRSRRARLTETVEWRARRNQDLNQLEREFLDASGQLATSELDASRRSNRRLRALLLGLGVLLVGAGYFALVARQQTGEAREQARRALSQRLALQVPTVAKTQPDLSLLLGLEGVRLASGDGEEQAQSALLTALGRPHHIATQLTQHSDQVRDVAFSPDGRILATASADRTIRLWNAANGKPHGKPLTGHTAGVAAVAFSPDGKLLASASDDQTLQLWSTARGTPRGPPLEGHTAAVTDVAFSPDGTKLASASRDRSVRLWNARTGKPRGSPMTGHTGPINAVAFSPDGRRLASGSDDKTLRRWDVATGRLLGGPLRGHTDAVSAVAFSPDGEKLLSASLDSSLQFWDAATGAARGRPIKTPNSVLGVAFSRDGRTLAWVGDDRGVRLWNPSARSAVGKPFLGHTDAVAAVAFSPDGKTLASASDDRTARLWQIAAVQPTTLRGHDGGVGGVAFSPDGAAIATGSLDETLRLWDARTGKPSLKPIQVGGNGIWDLAFSPDGRTIALGLFDGTVSLRDAATGEQRAVLAGHHGLVWEVSLSPDGQTIASAGNDKTVRLWDARTGAPKGRPLRGHTGWVTAVAFSPDGKLLASGSQDRTVRLWDVKTATPHGRPLKGHGDKINAVAFSPDGGRLVSASFDKTVRFWDPASGRKLGQPLAAHSDVVADVAFSPDGRTLASAGFDRMVRLWDPATRELRAPLVGHTRSVWDIAFSPDSRTIAAGGLDGTVRLWRTAVGASVAKACKIANRNLSRGEWDLYLGSAVPYERTCGALTAGKGAPRDSPAARY